MAGEDRWFKLEPRSSASRVQGDCQLVLKLITTQVGSCGVPCPAAAAPLPGAGAGLLMGGPAFQRDTAMSRRGRSGFLSYMLLLGRLLQFEYRPEEVAAPSRPGW